MTQEQEPLKTLSEIKSLMEKSSRFLSLSGLAGVFAGLFALAGAAFAYFYMDISLLDERYFDKGLIDSRLNLNFIFFFLIDAMIVLILAVGTGFYFTYRNASRKGLQVWTPATRRFMWSVLIPLIVGGLFCVLLVYNHAIGLVAPATLIFYGLALFNAGKYTLKDVQYLGLTEVLLGLIGCVWIGYGLIVWALGFGVLHIVYGIIMYFRYER